MKIKLLATLFLMILAKTYSQDAISKIIPPLPETASLIDGYKAQMNGYQGNASFSVSVYTIEEDGMSLPIYLSYSSNSNKVRERASRVGLGWNLFAGGSVSRSIRDIADEGPDGLLSCFKCNEEFYENREVREKFISIIGTGYYNVAKDLEPDLFHFNFLGYSGKFIIDNSTYKAIVQENNDLKIDLIFNSNHSELQKIVFTDPEGNKYYFGLNKDNNKESYERIQNASFYSFNTRNSSTSQGNNDNLGGGNFISAWNLLEIELVNKKKIVFDYGNQIISHKSISSITEPLEGNGGFEVINYMDIIGRESVLKSIKFSGGEVSFEYDLNNREDLSGSKALKKIKVLDSKNLVVKDYQLEHFYTEHTDRSNVIPVLSLDNTSYKRLHLKNVKQYNKDKGGYETFYDFEYNSKTLPSVHSTSLDLWGYFNNANNRFYLLKSDYVKREVDSIQSRASLLQKVKLPVGGYVEYIYERNSFIKPLEYDSFLIKGLEEKSSKPTDIYNTVAMAKMPIYYDSIRKRFSRDFSIETINHMSVEVRFEGPRGCDRAADHSCMYSVEIRDENNNLLHGNFDRGTRTISLANGRYKLLVIPRQRIDINDFEQGVFSIVLRWKKDQGTNEINNIEMVGPGNRLKRVNYYDHTGHLEDYMNYSYKGLQEKTSGKIFSIPTYKFIFKSQDGAIYPDRVTATLGNGIVSMFNTNDYGYEYITEYNDIERIRRRYTVFVDEGEYFLFDHHLPIDLSWTRGKLVEEEYYKRDTNQWKLIKQIKNNYQFYNRTSHPFPWSTGNLVSFVRIRPIPPRDLEDTNEPLKYSITDKLSIFPLYKFGYFVSTIEELNNRQPTSADRYRISYFIGGTMNLIETTVTDYEKEALSYREEFDYSSAKHNQVTEKRRIFADNSTYKSRYTYAPDLSSSAIATQMTNQNILSPLSVEELRGEEKIVLTKNNFSTLGNNAIRLSSVETQKANHALEEQFRINYNQNAKEIETLVNGVKTVYLYGYNQNLVIAKIENASKEEVASALGVSVSNLVTMNETKLSQINTLRTNSTLKEAMITTYEHKPLVGVIKIIDPKGRKSTYEYDGLNRLKAIKDDKGNSIEEYEYNYKQ